MPDPNSETLVNQYSALCCALFLFACGGSAPPPAEPTAPPASVDATGPTPAEATPGTAASPGAESAPASSANAFADQAKAGQELYGKYCAGCHGEHGNDGRSPHLVGLKEGALPLAPPPKSRMRTTQFKTAADVGDFVAKTMPPKAPGSLSADEYLAILAFDLKANGMDLGDKKLDAALAATLVIPRQ